MNFKNNFNYSRFQQYLDFLKASGTSQSTLDRKLSSLNSFQNFLVKKGYLVPTIKTSSNPILNLPPSPKNNFNGKNFVSRYLIFGTLIAIILGLGYGLYTQTILKAKSELAYSTATNPVKAGRILSFQGRLTDSVGNPITASTNVIFKFYNASVGGTELYNSSIGNSQVVVPDENGIFSVVIGKTNGTEIPSSVFSENAEVWLEITAGGETMNPRQQIATVAYALNSETLQGLPPSASGLKDTVLVIDSQGNLNLGETSPTIKSTSGTMAVEGQALLLKASDGSGGNITINPDGNGTIRFLTEGTSPSSGGFIDLSNANIAGGNLINSQINNDNRGYNFLSFQNYDTGTTTLSTRFSIDSYGNAYISKNLNLNNNLTIGGTFVSVGSTNLVTNLNANYLNGYSYNNLPYDNYQHWQLQTNGTGTTNINSQSLVNIISGTGISLSQNGSNITINSSGGIGTTYAAANGLNLNSGNFGLGGTLVQDTSINLNNHNLSLIGSGNFNLTGSKIDVTANNGGDTVFTTRISGDSFDRATIDSWGNYLTLGGIFSNNFAAKDSTNNISFLLPNSGKNLNFRDSSNTNTLVSFTGDGNVGIGTTSPTQKLDINGSINIGGSMAIGSSQLVTNLNADLLDGQNSSYFVNIGQTNVFIQNITSGTGISITGSGIGRTIAVNYGAGLSNSGSQLINSGIIDTTNTTLTKSGSLGSYTLGLNLANSNTWTAAQNFSNITVGGTFVSVGSTNLVTNLNANYLNGYSYNNLPYFNTASNGLNALNTNTIGLGGTLTQNTQIGTSSFNLSFLGLGGTQSLYIGSSGFVGIGNTNPIKLFSIGNGTSYPTSFDAGTLFTINKSNSASSWAAMSIISGTSGYSSLYFGSLTAENAGYVRYDNSANKLFLGSSQNDRLTINSTGNIGIGTTSPSKKLDIVGDINLSGTIFIGSGGTGIGTTGTSGQVLASNGSGGLQWISAGGVGTTYSATNGLTLGIGASNVFGLGGTLTQNTQIGTSSFNLSFLGLGGTQALFIDYQGYLGIGTTDTGLARLNIKGDSSKTTGLFVKSGDDGDGGGTGIMAEGTYSAITGSSTYGVAIDGYSADSAGIRGTGSIGVVAIGNTFDFYTDNTSGISYFGDNVGINTTNPTSKLEVNGDFELSNRLDLSSNYGAPASINNLLTIGSDTNYRWIQSYNSKPLVLNPIGNNVGIGTISPTSKLTLASTSSLESAPLGSELLSSGDTWTLASGWSGDFSSGFTHTAGTGNTGTVTDTTLVPTSGYLYQIAFTVTGRTAGTFTLSFGSETSNRSWSASSAWGVKATGTGTLSITPTSDFDGTIVISIKRITGTYSPTFNLADSTGTSSFEVRNSPASLYNTFIGVGTGRYNTTGSNNSAQGYASLYSNTTGYQNTAQGYNSLYLNTTGNLNSAQGYSSLYSNTTGYSNSAQGYASLLNNTTGYSNSALGFNAGRYIANGSTANQTSNTSLYLGASTKSLASGDTNETVIGYNATGIGNNSVVLGNDSVTTTALKGNVGIGTTNPQQALQVGDQNGKYALFTSSSATADLGGILLSNQADSTSGHNSLKMTSTYNGTTSARAKIGFVDNSNLENFLNSGPAMELRYNGNVFLAQGTGNVGIGTTSPSQKLDINGSINIGGSMAIGSSQLVTNLNADLFDGHHSTDYLMNLTAGIGITITGTNSTRNIAFDPTQITNTTFGNGSTFTWTFNTGNTKPTINFNNNGYIGIGTSSAPRTALEVNGTIAAQKFVDLTSYDQFFMDLANSDYNSSSLALDRRGSIKWNSTYNSGWKTIDNGAASKIENEQNGLLLATSVGTTTAGSSITDWNQNIFLSNNGNVGIGTTNPNSKLEISGSTSTISNTSGDINIDSASGLISFSSDSITNFLQALAGSGSASLPSYSFSSDPVTGIFSGGIGKINIGTSGVARLTVDASGNVGIGTTNPTARLEIANSTSTITNTSGDITISAASGTISLSSNLLTNYLRSTAGSGSVSAPTYSFSSDTDTGMYAGGANILNLATGGNNRLTIDASGNVGIGTTSPTGTLEIYGDSQLTTALTDTGSRSGILALNGSSSSAGSGGTITFGNGQSKTAGSIGFAAIKGYLRNGSYNTAGDIVFSTRSNPTNTALTENMRITYNGLVGIGTTNPDGALQVYGWFNGAPTTAGVYMGATTYAGIELKPGTGGGSYIDFHADGESSSDYAARIFRETGSSGNFVVSNNSSGVYLASGATSWSSASDIRLKNVTGGFTSALSDISKLNPVHFTWKNDPTNTSNVGLIAQDVQKVLPEAVSVNNDGYLGVRYTDLIPLLTAALQELNTKVDDIFVSSNGQIAVNFNVSDEVLASLGYSDTKDEIENATYSLTDSTGKLVTSIVQFAQVTAAKITAGLISAKNVIAENLSAKRITSETVLTGDLSATTVESDSVTVSNTLTAQNIGASTATFSTVYASQIINPEGNISDVFAAKINSLRQELSNMIASSSATATPSAIATIATTWDTSIATDSADLTLDNLALNDNLTVGAMLTVNGQTMLNSVNISNILTVGQIAIQDNILETTADNLYFQPSGNGTIHFLNDRLVLASDGSVTINGNVKINGSLVASLLQADTIETKNLTTEKINIATTSTEPIIATDASSSATATTSATLASNATVGTVTLAAGQTEVTIQNTNLTSSSMIYLTPNGSTQNQVPYLKNKSGDTFTIAIDSPLSQNVDINWWLIN